MGNGIEPYGNLTRVFRVPFGWIGHFGERAVDLVDDFRKLTDQEILQLWIRHHGKLSIRQQQTFLVQPEVARMVKIIGWLVDEGVREHQKLEKALEHIIWRISLARSTEASAGPCGCLSINLEHWKSQIPNDQVTREQVEPRKSGKGGRTSTNVKPANQRSLRARRKAKKVRKTKKGAEPVNNRFPFGSDRWGGAYRSPPTGGIAKGW
jgi:hypothetical protein